MEELDLKELWAKGKVTVVEEDPAELSRQAAIRTNAALKDIIHLLVATQRVYHEIEKSFPQTTSKHIRLLGLGAEIRWLKNERKRLERKLSYHQEMVRKLTPSPKDKLDKLISEYEEKLAILKKERVNFF